MKFEMAFIEEILISTKNRPNDQLPDDLLAQLVRALHRYRRGYRVRILYKPDFFFRLSFHNCNSCVTL